MKQLYPLKFSPIIKNPIWGGSKLRDNLGKKEAQDNSGESWEISGVKNNISVVSNGFLEGNELTDLIEVYMGDLVGQKVFEKFGPEFPLLIKFIDASDDLSIQVHPKDEVALERHNSFGKTEMWYVIQADKDTQLISGFKRKVDKDTYVAHLKSETLQSIVNQEKVNSGDVYFIPAGRIHAIGKGILLAEIQQTSNITYRVYDYKRTDSDGNERELHTELAVDVIDYNHYPEYKTIYASKPNSPVNLANCQYFTTNILEIDQIMERDMIAYDSFIVYMVIEGEAEIQYRDKQIERIVKGETILMPSEISHYYINPMGRTKLLEIYIAYEKEEDED